MNIFRGRVRWMLIAWMLVISAVSYLDRVNISIAGPFIEREFHLDHIRLGWVFSAWVLGYALFQAPSGRLADRFGPRKVLTVGALWWAPVHCAYSPHALEHRRFISHPDDGAVFFGRG